MKAIKARRLSKSYRLTQPVQGGLSRFISDRLYLSLPEQARRATMEDGRISDGVLRALDDVTFDVAFGDVLGIMGPNGAGKSTLLKLLSRITAPTSGTAVLRGRVGALLEVGIGFNYELSGRENILLNGLTLGMTRGEIDRRFDEIVEFAGVENFLDTPVKRYSSGMVARLGFAVAAHLEPEILIVDEILAVGDADFQRRCIDRMRHIASNEGRAVLFISHSMEAVLSVCSRAIRLEGGRLVQDGTTRDVVAGYLGAAERRGSTAALLQRTDREGTGELQIVGATVSAPGTRADSVGMVGQTLTVALLLEPHHDRIRDVTVELAVKDIHRTTVTVLANAPVGQAIKAVTVMTRLEVSVPRLALVPGQYWIDGLLRAEGRIVDKIAGIANFEVVAAPFYSDLMLQVPGGVVLLEQSWKVLS